MNERSLGDRVTGSPPFGEPVSLGVVDRYLLQERIGQGGFGSVWKAFDQEARMRVAIKALHPLIASNRDELERVRSNFVLVSRLTHPSICVLRHLHRIDQVDVQAQSNLRVGQGDYLVVMDFVDGVTLTQYRLARGGTLPPDEAADLCRQIGEALDYAHSQRIVHRDVKPSNIMITQGAGGKRSVKILDFGLAAEIRNSLSRVSRDLGDTTGTRPYMAPEQWSGRRQNAFSDQYSLAIVFYELISGEVPFASAFESGDPIVMMNVVRTEPVEPLEDLTLVQNTALARATSKAREDRWPTCVAFVQAVGTGTHAVEAKSRPKTKLPKSEKARLKKNKKRAASPEAGSIADTEQRRGKGCLVTGLGLLLTVSGFYSVAVGLGFVAVSDLRFIVGLPLIGVGLVIFPVGWRLGYEPRARKKPKQATGGDK